MQEKKPGVIPSAPGPSAAAAAVLSTWYCHRAPYRPWRPRPRCFQTRRRRRVPGLSHMAPGRFASATVVSLGQGSHIALDGPRRASCEKPPARRRHHETVGAGSQDFCAPRRRRPPPSLLPPAARGRYFGRRRA